MQARWVIFQKFYMMSLGANDIDLNDVFYGDTPISLILATPILKL